MPTLKLLDNALRIPQVLLRIAGREHIFVLDTGAEKTLLQAGMFISPMQVARAMAEGNLSGAHGISGSINHIYTTDVRLNFIGVSISHIAHVDFNQDLFRHSGVLISAIIGNDILRQFKTVTFDYYNRTVRFEHQT